VSVKLTKMLCPKDIGSRLAISLAACSNMRFMNNMMIKLTIWPWVPVVHMVTAPDTGRKISVVQAGSIGVHGNMLHQLRHILVPFFTTGAGPNSKVETLLN
jgi:hypothetical protein